MANSQGVALEVAASEADWPILKANKAYQEKYESERLAQLALANILKDLKSDGYLAASFDDLESDSVLVKADFYLGERYEWMQLAVDSIDEKILSKIGYRPGAFRGKPFSIEEVRRLQERLLTYYENNGYPFAEVGLTDLAMQEEQISANLSLEKGALIRIDSLALHTYAHLSRQYLANYLGIEQGMIYNESLLRQISSRLREIPFVSESAPSTVDFIGSKARVNVYLKRQKASRLNFILGVLPKSDGEGFDITGDGELVLQNALGSGELIGLEYQAYPAKATELNLKFNYPYLPLLPIGIDLAFDLYRKDTLFSEIHYNLGVQYTFKGNNYIKAFYDRKRSSPISEFGNENVLPSILGVLTSAYGLSWNWEQLDYRYNPRRGITLSSSAALGVKTYANDSILQIIDETAESWQLQWQLEAGVSRYWPIGAGSTIKTSLRGAWLELANGGSNNINLLFENELYRIGGNKLLRGFDEQSILSNLYLLNTLEYRYLMSQNSYVSLFGDAAYVENNNSTESDKSWYYGLGAGITFETKAGLFGLNYALGKRAGNSFDLRSGKIHFGYVNYF